MLQLCLAVEDCLLIQWPEQLMQMYALDLFTTAQFVPSYMFVISRILLCGGIHVLACEQISPDNMLLYYESPCKSIQDRDNQV